MYVFLYSCLVAIALCVICARNRSALGRALAILGVAVGAFVIFGFSTVSFGLDRGIAGPGVLATVSSPWKEVILFVSMIMGMISKFLWDAIEERRRRKAKQKDGLPATLQFDVWEFIQPILVAGILFAPIIKSAEELSVSLVLFSYQNGFFWQTVLFAAPKDNRGKAHRTA